MINIKVHTCFLGHTGYAYHARSFATALSKYCNVKVRNFTYDDNWGDYLTEHQKSLVIEQTLTDNDGERKDYPALWKNEIEYFEPDVDIVLMENNHYYYFDQSKYKGKIKIAYLVWETTLLTQDFFTHLQKNFDYFFCPSSWQKECMIRQGWDKDKIFIIPEGVDSELKPSDNLEYLLSLREFRFFLAGRWDYRKSTTEILRAFKEEFKHDQNVKLICSINNQFAKDGLTTEQRLIKNDLLHSSIKIVNFPKREEYIKLMQYAHCHISCSRAEGWGLPISDAIACGTPTIYAHNTAPSDFASEIGIPVYTKNITPASPMVFFEGVEGNYYEPDFDQLKSQMRFAFKNFRNLKNNSLQYSPTFIKKYSWDRQANKALEILKKIEPKQKNNELLLNQNKIKSRKDAVWVFTFSKDYEFYADNLIQQIPKYSNLDILPYAINFNKKGCQRLNIDLSKRKENYWENLKYKNFNKYYSKIYAAVDSLKWKYKKFIFIDVDMIPIGNIDSILDCFDNLDNYPLFSRYFYEFINNYTEFLGKRREGYYGKEIEGILKTKRNLNYLLSSGIFIYNTECKKFFEDCIKTYNEIKEYDLTEFSDDNAISEERLINGMFWKNKYTKHLPLTWKNKSHNYQGQQNKFVNYGFDVFYNTENNEEIFLHGPDPSINSKTKESIDFVVNDTETEQKLMIVAHLDDESIFGGNELINEKDWTLVVATKPTEERLSEFKNTLSIHGNVKEIKILGFKDDFFANLDPESLRLQIKNIITSKKWKKIVTHNPVGEYGHLHHRNVFEAVKSLTDNFYVFCKDNSFLNKRQNLLNCYISQQEIISQLKLKNGDWYISRDNKTNYIDNVGVSKYDNNLDINTFIPCYEKSLPKSSPQKKCFFITSHCNTDAKLRELEKCISRLAVYKKDYDIFIYSSLSLPERIQNTVDGFYNFFYNPILPIEERTIIFYDKINDVKVSSFQPDYGTAAITQIKNCVLISNVLGYEICSIVNYDTVFDETLWQNHDQEISKMDDSLCYLREEGDVNLLLFSVRNNKKTFEVFNSISLKEYHACNNVVAESYLKNNIFNKLECRYFKHTSYNSKKINAKNILYDTVDYDNFKDHIFKLKTKNFLFNFSIHIEEKENDNAFLIVSVVVVNSSHLKLNIDGKTIFNKEVNIDKIIRTSIPKKYISQIEVYDKNSVHYIESDSFDDYDFIEFTKEKEVLLLKQDLLIDAEPLEDVFINCDSSSLGDNIAWIPYVDDYAKKNNYNIYYFSKWKSLFEKEYLNINFVNSYQEGKSKKASKEIFLGVDLTNDNKYISQTTLQKVASDIFNLQFEEKKPKIFVKNTTSKYKKKYVCIGTQSTCQAKYWTKEGWEKIIQYLKSLDYEVVCIDKYYSFGIENYMNDIPEGCIDKTGDIDIQERITDIVNCDFFIGLGSGLSWLAWALNKPVVMISGFSNPSSEFFTPYRVFNENVCNSCWNDESCEFDKSDWLWCPRNKNFECSKNITPYMVKEKIDMLISNNKY